MTKKNIFKIVILFYLLSFLALGTAFVERMPSLAIAVLIGWLWFGFIIIVNRHYFYSLIMASADSPKSVPAEVPLTYYSDFVHLEANRKFYVKLLGAFEKVAFDLGYFFSSGSGLEIGVLSNIEKEDVARAIAAARVRHLYPNLDEDKIESRVEFDMDDGYSLAMVDEILDALATKGVFLKRRNGFTA